MKTFALAALGGILAAAGGCAHSAPAEDTGEAVELEASFLLPPRDGASPSHSPSVVFTADGKRMLTATSDNEIAVFDVATRRLLRRIRFPEEGTDGVALDASGRFAAWALKTGGLAVVEIASGKVVARDGTLAARWVAASPDGRRLAVSRGRELEIRALPSLALERSLGSHEAEVTNLTWSSDGARLASTAEDGRLLLHDATSGRTVLAVKKDAPLYAVAFHPRGGAVAYGGRDQKVYQYTFAPAGEEIVSQNQPYWITCLGYSPDGERLAAGDESCDIWLYRVKTQELTFHSKHHVECWLSAVAWAPDNETFLFGCRPNAHAGRPTLYEPLVWTEAQKCREVRSSREALLQALDDELARVQDAGARQALEAYRASLTGAPAGAAAAPAAGLALASPSAASGGALTGATFSLAEPGPKAPEIPPAERLPEGLRKFAREHEAALENETRRLKSNYRINQWKVRK
jgi:hypothetical protein